MKRLIAFIALLCGCGVALGAPAGGIAFPDGSVQTTAGMINTGTPLVGALPAATDVTGTNWGPATLNWTTDANTKYLKWPAFYHTPYWRIAERWTANGDGTTNDVLSFGFNTVAGSQETAGKPTIAFNLENDYLGQTEFHVDMVGTNGSAFRPIGANGVFAGGNSISLLFNANSLSIADQTQGNTYFQFFPTSATLNAGGRMELEANSYLLLKNAAGSTVGFIVGGTDNVDIKGNGGAATNLFLENMGHVKLGTGTGIAIDGAAGTLRVSDASTGIGKLLYRNPVTVGGDITLGTANSIVILNVDNKTATLPAAATANQGKEYVIKVVAPATTGTVSGTIDGVSGFSLSASNKFIRVASDGTNWWNVGSN